jgi:ribosomal protection tetracycline resistance protein
LRTLNLGILAHVDAGKTTLTERLLYAAGVIDEIGSVDDGSTQTDSLALERQRGITIKSAVVSFVISDVTVNLIDTPGHPDFIAEVERVLSVLDGAVLVVSGVEGVQPQTRILMRTLQRLRIPTLIFVNKMDRMGADYERTVHAIGELTKQAQVHPVFSGSAITGAGVESLMAGIAELLPAAEGDVDAPVSGTVFKIERGRAGEKIAYVRMFSGTVRTRDRLQFHADLEPKVTAINVFERGSAVRRPSLAAGDIGKLWGLSDVRIGDSFGAPRPTADLGHFAPPTLEAVVVPRSSDDRGRLRVALAQLAEQDPLINVRQDDSRQEISVSLYGEIQKEVIQATLANDFGLDITFRETTVVCIERPIGTGHAVEFLQAETHPFSATIGLRIEPDAPGSGVQFRLDVDPRLIPLHIYKTKKRFIEAMTQYTCRTLEKGLFGWQVTDCAVTMTDCGYYASDGPPKPTMPTPRATAADFRHLTPRVLTLALQQAKTVVCEPILRVSVEVPADAVGAVLAAISRLGEVVETPSRRESLSVVEGLLPAARAQDLTRGLPRLTGGEGVVETNFGGYRPVRGVPPRRRRSR